MTALTGKIALVTGAGKGLGRTLAQALAAQGAFVAANDISPINLDPVVAGILAAGGRARACVHDVAKKVDVQAMVNDLHDEFGRIDLLVNCAHVEPRTGLLELDEWDLHRVFEVNAIGTLLMIQSVGRIMRAQGGGIIINVLTLPPDAPASYLASRAGLAALIPRAAAELAPHGIRLFTVSGEDAPRQVLALCAEHWTPKSPDFGA
jgi:2-deoxy-D-gluconate 3-dehydrogenase